MPSFYNPQRNYVLTTNLKVMYSTLCRQPSLRLLPTDVHAALRVWLAPGVRRYLLVRNPYDRLVSFFADKFSTTPADDGMNAWQDCQRLFFPALGLNGREDMNVIAERLRAVTFERFIDLLPRVYRRDAHLWPQHWSARFRLYGLSIPAPIHAVFKIEEDRRILCDDLGLDLTTQVNASQHGAHDRYFVATTYAVANEVYRVDFERFNYPIAGNGDSVPTWIRSGAAS